MSGFVLQSKAANIHSFLLFEAWRWNQVLQLESIFFCLIQIPVHTKLNKFKYGVLIVLDIMKGAIKQKGCSS